MMDITLLGPMLIGAVIGWTLYFFVRRFSLFSPRALAATLGAVLAGPALSFVTQLGSGTSGVRIQSSYFLGVGVGFFANAGYLGLLVFLFGRGRINAHEFEMMASKIAILRKYERGENRKWQEFIKIMSAVEKWSTGKISEDKLRKLVKGLHLTRGEFQRYRLRLPARLSSRALKHAAILTAKNFESVDQLGLRNELKGTERKEGKVQSASSTSMP